MRVFYEFMFHCVLLWFMFSNNKCNAESAKDVYVKECQGSSTGLAHSGVASHRYKKYREMYENCTLVTLNLEVVFLEGLTDDQYDQYDLSFLENIREVNGYVLIYGNYVSKIRLNRLRVIRGVTLYKDSFSLYVTRNGHPGNDSVGLKELQMTSLVEILHGDILFSDNRQLCFGENTINWRHIINHDDQGLFINQETWKGYEKIDCQRYGTCHENCTAADGQRYCWGRGPDMCQPVHTCGGCGDNRCSLRRENSCCSRECIAGCNAPEADSQCLSCKYYARNNGEHCVESCKAEVYNEHKSSWEIPQDKYTQGTKCVKKCDGNMVLQDGRCSSNCKQGFMENKTSELRECVPCPDACPITCRGTNADPWIHRRNLHGFSNCVKVVGDIKINNLTFTGHPVGEGILPEELEILSTVEEITGSLVVEAWYSGFTSLRFLRNLRVIEGAGSGVSESKRGLLAYETSLTSVELNSLESVKNGRITFLNNSQLCFVEGISWSTVKGTQLRTIKNNKNSSLCDEEGFVCSQSCDTSNGCMGPGNDSCISCSNFYSMDGSCLSDCSAEEGYYIKTDGLRGNRECRPCDQECKGSCNGDGPQHCFECKHFKYEDACIAECPSDMYPDDSATCQLCNDVCNQCTGNSTILGVSGCNDCRNRTIRYEDATNGHCITNENECDERYFTRDEAIPIFTGENNEKIAMKACRKCHPECNGCTGEKPSECSACKHYRQNNTNGITECVSGCSELFYDDGNSWCAPCHRECSICYGPSEFDCHLCKNVRITNSEMDEVNVANDTHGKSFCAEECPEDLQRRKKENSTESICVSHGFLRPERAIPVFVVLFLIIVAVVVVIFVVFWRKQKMRRLRDNILALDEIPVISCSKAKPDMALLRLIKESELRRGNVIGSGAFGTVYKGVWIPDKENVKIPVAIKVLQETSNTNLNVELLDEARIMASVCHPYCVRILAVCMTAQMMLITQLMPLGCLLDYVRKEKSNIGSRALLLWSVQIAKGMKYLEELGIVHRDLAARNVLVHNPNQVKITDFGLAKLLDYEEEEIHSEGGKMPIKWLALECIQHRTYTHKSDVWSYGVTLWEMFSYGERPYENLQARQVPQALEKGERLPQPSICTIDVYTILIKCWMLDFDSRPTFSDLANEFTRMAADPGRYLVIPGDALMRLPSRAPEASDLIRLMSLPVDEPDLKIVSGDEYLRPMDMDYDTSDGSGPPNSSNLGYLLSIPEDAGYENTARKEDGSNGKSFGKLTHQSSEEQVQRYIADPCRTEGGGKESGKPMEKNPTFPVGEDGYLPPKSISDQPNYLDLLDKDSKAGSPPSQNQQAYLDMNTNLGVSRDNLEYFDNDAACLTGDVPTTNKAYVNIGPDKMNTKNSEYFNVTSKSADQASPYKRL